MLGRIELHDTVSVQIQEGHKTVMAVIEVLK